MSGVVRMKRRVENQSQCEPIARLHCYANSFHYKPIRYRILLYRPIRSALPPFPRDINAIILNSIVYATSLYVSLASFLLLLA